MTGLSLEQAMEAHRAGRLTEAEFAYGRLLDDDPNHADASHLLGLVHHRHSHPQHLLDGQAKVVQPGQLNPAETDHIFVFIMKTMEAPDQTHICIKQLQLLLVRNILYLQLSITTQLLQFILV